MIFIIIHESAALFGLTDDRETLGHKKSLRLNISYDDSLKRLIDIVYTWHLFTLTYP